MSVGIEYNESYTHTNHISLSLHRCMLYGQLMGNISLHADEGNRSSCCVPHLQSEGTVTYHSITSQARQRHRRDTETCLAHRCIIDRIHCQEHQYRAQHTLLSAQLAFTTGTLGHRSNVQQIEEGVAVLFVVLNDSADFFVLLTGLPDLLDSLWVSALACSTQ